MKEKGKATIADPDKIFFEATGAKAESVANNMQKFVAELLAPNKPIILFNFLHIKIQVFSCNFLSFLSCKKNDAPWRNSFVKFQKGNAIYNEI